MRAAIDLHIHTALSPCADDDMTPNNIVGMAWLKGLDIIAVTDHNAAMNCEAVMECAKEKGILFIPGMEVESSEEVHLVCLFPCIESVLKMQDIIHAALPNIENREDIFGKQVVMDKNDNVVGYFPKLLINAAGLGIDEIFSDVDKLGGVTIPAHVDRDSYSIISNLGIIPEYLEIKTLEISRDTDLKKYIERNPHLKPYSFVRSSDAHHLGDILERESYIDLEELSARCLIDTIKKGIKMPAA